MSKSASKGTVVIVDDDPKIRRIYTDFLEAQGYTVMAARSGVEGINLVTRVRPKMVLLDIMMPDLDGLETCRRMREVLGTGVPIVFLTALDTAEHVRKGLLAGGDDYLIKSGQLSSLLKRVEAWSGWDVRGSADRRRKRALEEVDTVGAGDDDIFWVDDAPSGR